MYIFLSLFFLSALRALVHTLTNLTLIIAKHEWCFDIICQGLKLLGAKHEFQKRKDALWCCWSWRDRKSCLRGCSPCLDFGLVCLPELEDCFSTYTVYIRRMCAASIVYIVDISIFFFARYARIYRAEYRDKFISSKCLHIIEKKSFLFNSD